MGIHREGASTLLFLAIVITALAYILYQIVPFLLIVGTIAIAGFGFFLQFFRNPKRVIPTLSDELVYAPADGKVVVIEEVVETEFFQTPRRQVSIFMSPTNVHVNRSPVGGQIEYVKYHPGRYLVAWNPKSSTDNERNTVVYNTGSHQILMRQIAGAVARRIKCYVTPQQWVEQGQEMGFIKFGSRVDLFLPLDAEIVAQIGTSVQGNMDVIAKLPAK
ncbi:MAG: phosphatidylserine decarboxylase family protein [Bacteroidota bacterium]